MADIGGPDLPVAHASDHAVHASQDVAAVVLLDPQDQQAARASHPGVAEVAHPKVAADSA